MSKRISELEEVSQVGSADLLEVSVSQGGGAYASRKVSVSDLVGGGGAVVGPSSATDGAVALFNGTTGKLIKNGGAGILTSLALGGASIGSNDFATIGAASFGGNVGIGMTPVNVLDITKNQASNSYGNLLNSTSTGGAYWRTTNGTAESRFGVIGTAGAFGAFSNNDTVIYGSSAISIATAGAIKFAPGNGGIAGQWGTDGKFVVGATAPWAGATIEGVAGDGGFGISGYAASTSGQAVLSRVDSTASYLFGMYYSTGIVAYYTTNGSTATFNSPSDARFKNVRADQANFRTALQQLWVGEFDWKDSEKAYGFGLLAQQMYSVLPDSAKDFFVSKPDNDDDKWFLKENHLPYLALWGVKDLYREIEQCRAEIAALKAGPPA